MQIKENNTDTHLRNLEPDEELAGILTAISIVSKRLAKKLLALQKRDGSTQKGGNPDEQDE
mgnify:CR=1 FL=1